MELGMFCIGGAVFGVVLAGSISFISSLLAIREINCRQDKAERRAAETGS